MCAAVAIAAPIIYLVTRMLQADAAQVLGDLFRHRTLGLLWNTAALCVGVLVFTILIAFPIAYVTTQTNLRGRGVFALIGVLPLAVPGYIMAYALLSVGGYGGLWHHLTGQTVGVPSGYWGALITLGLYNSPYMMLNLRSAMLELDPALAHAGRSLGRSRFSVFFRITLPQLRPALLTGALLVMLHVVGDFAVVSLMRYETFSAALYYSYRYSIAHAAGPALSLIAMSGVMLAVDFWFLRRLLLFPSGAQARPRRRAVRLGWWSVPAYLLLTVIALISVAGPVATLLFWAVEPADVGGYPAIWPALRGSLAVSLPGALAATALALPIALLARRYPSPLTAVLERFAFVGYAIPPLAFALSLIVLTRGMMIYRTLIVLIGAYALHFLAEAVGPVRSGLFCASPHLEEAARGLGRGRLATAATITLPLLRHSLIVSAALVFLSIMKELPLTILLKPDGYETLAINVWSYAEDQYYAQAAPFALCILLTSAAFVGVLTIEYRKTT